MHLLAADAGRIDDGEPVDLALEPAPIVMLSAGDGEIAAMARAVAASPDGPAVRLASLNALNHPMSVDLLADATLRHAKVVAVRVLGGEGYFAYGIEVLRRLALAGGLELILVPGEADFDPALAARGTVPLALSRTFHDLCREGGPANRAGALTLLRHLVDGRTPPPPAQPLPVAGLYAKGTIPGSVDELRAIYGDRTAVGVVFYRAHLVDGLTGGIDGLTAALAEQHLPVPIYASSLKDQAAAGVVRALLRDAGAKTVISTMGFSAGENSPLDDGDRVVLQAVQPGEPVDDWRDRMAGLSVRDLAMNVVTPEMDGRVLSRAFAFKTKGRRDPATGAFPVSYQTVADRCAFIASLAARQVVLSAPASGKAVALVLANYPGKAGRIANGVGLDTPASAVNILRSLKADGWAVGDVPADSDALMTRLSAAHAAPAHRLPLSAYTAWFQTLPKPAQDAVNAQWGPPERDPSVADGAFHLAMVGYGAATVAIQPTRGYERDVKATYHDPALVPTHAYLAFYLALKSSVDAVVHVGKHGNMEWLPGKAVALTEECWPEIAFGAMPHVYPFIVNDPGEGSQAKRRAQAVIVDHLTPPMTEAGNYGSGADVEALIDEYALARAMDPTRAEALADAIVDEAERTGLLADIGVTAGGDRDDAIAAIDAHICDLKEMQIRDGLHVLGEAPTGEQRTGTLAAIARAPRGTGPADASLLRALADDLSLEFDPLTADRAAPWTGPKPTRLVSNTPWRTAGDTVERLAECARDILQGSEPPGPASAAVIASITEVGTDLDRSGDAELTAVSRALQNVFVAPGPSGAPTRGRPDVLPTGRNFYAVDIRAIPTPTAWSIGQAAADAVVQRFVMEEGDWPRTLMLTCWGTANMRTGGDDIAQALALIGAAPIWDGPRITGFSVTPLSTLRRPRIDVTLRVSGFFRDAFPEQIALFDSAIRAVARRDEPADQNPIRQRFAAGDGADISVFGAMPGAYGAGLQALIDTGEWSGRGELAEAYIAWGKFAYGGGRTGEAADQALRQRLATVEGVVQAQDNREHDLLDSDDYYQFEGGIAAAVEQERGAAPLSLHVDTSLVERPVARTLSEEISRVVRGRAANPRWIQGVMRHGYKGGFEIAATVDYLFAFAASTNAVADRHFDQLYGAYIDDETVVTFLKRHNEAALAEIEARFAEAIRRGLWQPQQNSVAERLSAYLCPPAEAAPKGG